MNAENFRSLAGAGPVPGWSGILREIRYGSAESLATLLEQFRPYLLTIANETLSRPLGKKFGASDAVQDAIIKGYQSFSAFKGSSQEELAGWLRAILLNRLNNLADAYHSDKRAIVREQPVNRRIVQRSEPTPSRAMLSNEERELLERAMARLPEEMRRVLLLRHRDNLSFAELGAALGLSETGARKCWTRSVRALRMELEALDSSRL
jgi:RNA polymerase sigma-70 factor (ECF subfamily)